MGLEVVELMHDRDRGGVFRERDRFLDGGVAAADGHDVLAGEEVAVTGRAVGDAPAFECGLGRQPERTRNAAGGDDQRGGREGALVFDFHQLGRTREVDARELHVGHQVAAELRRLGLHGHGDIATRRLQHARVVGHGVRHDHLAAERTAVDDQCLDSRAAEVDPCREPGGTPAENDHVVVLVHGWSPAGLVGVTRSRRREDPSERIRVRGPR